MALRLENILVAVDESDVSARALSWAIDLAQTLSATVHLLHVYTIPVSGLVPDGGFIAPAANAVHLSDVGQRRLDALAHNHAGSGVPLVKILREGIPEEEIVDEAVRVSADLIVVGTHGRHGIIHALLGSTSEAVVRAANVPVVTIRGT